MPFNQTRCGRQSVDIFQWENTIDFWTSHLSKYDQIFLFNFLIMDTCILFFKYIWQLPHTRSPASPMRQDTNTCTAIRIIIFFFNWSTRVVRYNCLSVGQMAQSHWNKTESAHLFCTVHLCNCK